MDNKPLDLTPEQVEVILQNGQPPIPLNTVIDDRRMKPFLSIQEFEKKWGIQSGEQQ